MKISKSDIARRVLILINDAVGSNPAGVCVYATTFGYAILRQYGLTVDIFGGSMAWPIVDAEQYGKAEITHLSYRWQGNRDLGFSQIGTGELPEIHMWLGVRETLEYVDFSVHRLGKAAKTLGLDWQGPEPPTYFWGNVLPNGVLYERDLEASSYAKATVIKCLSDQSHLLTALEHLQMPDLQLQIAQAGTPVPHWNNAV